MLLTGLRALQVALGAVCLYLAYAAVSPAMGAVSPEFELPARAVATSTSEPFDPEKAKLVTERDLFGGLAPPEVTDPGPGPEEEVGISKKQYKLFGTLVSSQDEGSIATLFHIARRESLVVRNGDPLENCSIDRIERKRVVLRCNGELEAIQIDDDEIGAVASARPEPRRRSVARRPEPAPVRPASSDLQARLEKIRAARERNQEREAARARGLMHQAKITPSFGDDGSFEGIVVNDAKPDGPMADLPDGSKCFRINGGEIGNIQDLSPVLQSVEGESVSLTCRTPDGQEITVNL